MKIAALCIAFLLVGCGPPPEPKWSSNQCMRVELFQQCLRLLPQGPQSTKYNDWDEVVQQCDATSYKQSLRKTDQVPKECQ